MVHIFETDSLESIEYKEASGEEMSFVKEDDTWEYAPDTTIALTESSMQNMEDAFSDIRAVKEIKNPDDLSDYGFDSPEYNLTLTGKDGEAHKISNRECFRRKLLFHGRWNRKKCTRYRQI